MQDNYNKLSQHVKMNAENQFIRRYNAQKQ